MVQCTNLRSNCMIKKLLLATIILLFATACTAKTSVSVPVQSQPEPTPPTVQNIPPATPSSNGLANQEWGSASLILDIGSDSSTVTLGCSNGEIPEPFTFVEASTNDDFSLAGTFHPEGPPRATINPVTGSPITPDYSAVFSGSISNGMMHLTITPKDMPGQSYDLTQGHFTLPRQACPL